MRVTIIHHNDTDGWCAAAIAKMFLEAQGKEIKFIEMDYDRHNPYILSEYLVTSKEIYILDYSFSTEFMDELCHGLGYENIIWIDHHKTAIEKLKNFSTLKGIRDVTKSACLLTWEFFSPTPKQVPYPVRLIADRDIWKYDFGDDSRGFFEWGLFQDLTPQSPLWSKLLSYSIDQTEPLINEGLNFRKIRLHHCKKQIEKLGYEIDIEIEGKVYKALKMNSTAWESISDIGNMILTDFGYEVALMYYETGEARIYQLRSKTVDVSAYARLHGGGGHKNSAGFMEMFEKPIAIPQK